MGWDQVGTCGIGALTSNGGRTLLGVGEIREDSLEARVPETQGPGGSRRRRRSRARSLPQPRPTPHHSQRTELGGPVPGRARA